MKTLVKTKSSKSLKTNKGRDLAKPQAQRSLKVYKEKKSLNYKLLGFFLLCTIGSFILGQNYSTHPGASVAKYKASSSIMNFYPEKETSIAQNVEYKEIVFDNYLEKLNQKEFKDYREYLAESSYVKDLFRQDMKYNLDVFASTHQITGRDSQKYIDFNKSQRELRVKFSQAMDAHKEGFLGYIRTKRKVTQL